MLESTGRHNVLFVRQYDEYVDRRLKGVLYTSFERFVYCNPVLLWNSQNIQHQFRTKTLGEAYWLKKIEQFRLVRKELKRRA